MLGTVRPVPCGDPAIFACPASAPFLKTVAHAILNGSLFGNAASLPQALPKITIYLPSRAGVKALKLAFADCAPNKATLLPRIHVLGESEPLDVFAAFGPAMRPEAALDLLGRLAALPPAFKALERKLFLCSLAREAAQTLRSVRAEPGEAVFAPLSPSAAYDIAGEIAALIDDCLSEGVSPSTAARLESSFATGSEQLSRQLLKSVFTGWQTIAARHGKIDEAGRRNRLMALEVEAIRESSSPVIIAGSTGSIAATADLMAAALSRPGGAVVLHGVDTHLSNGAWAAANATPSHGQHGLAQLLERLQVSRAQVRTLAVSEIFSSKSARNGFVSRALLPGSVLTEWAETANAPNSRNAALGVEIIEAATPHEEASLIALILRESLETPHKTAALVTPDADLRNRVRHRLAAWGVVSEPQPLSDGDALAEAAAACAARERPEDLVGLLFASGTATNKWVRAAEILDLAVLRQIWRPFSVKDVTQALTRAENAVARGKARHAALRRVHLGEWDVVKEAVAQALEALAPLFAHRMERKPMTDWVVCHGAAMARLAQAGLVSNNGHSRSLTVLANSVLPSFELDLPSYANLFETVCRDQREGAFPEPHPRLRLWSPLDARLQSVDRIVLGGLNEGVWPAKVAPNPWLNTSERAAIGLEPEERQIGQAAHDFATLIASAEQVYLTRARKAGGSLTRPSRWLSRLQAFAQGAGASTSLAPRQPWLAWVKALDAPRAAPAPAKRPEPRPDAASRPRKLSVTAIETWLANPYAIYARHILGLDPLRRPEEQQDARDKGILYHAAIHRFLKDYPEMLPQDAAAILLANLEAAAACEHFNLENAPLWRPRFARFAEWFAATEGERRNGVTAIWSERGGTLTLDMPGGPFTVTARADRIDVLGDGSLRIYDVKTSTNTAQKSVRRGVPQLSLEGFLAQEGAFSAIAAAPVTNLTYIVATGGEPPGEMIPAKGVATEAIAAVKAGLVSLITRFDDAETPYRYEARAIYQDKADNDPYAHLARLQEWRADGGDASDE